MFWIHNWGEEFNPPLHDIGLAKKFVQGFLTILQSFGILTSAKLLSVVMQIDTRHGIRAWS